MHQKLTGSSDLAMIEDGLNRILFVVSVDGGWIWWDSPREQFWIIVISKLEASGVNFGVDVVLRW